MKVKDIILERATITQGKDKAEMAYLTKVAEFLSNHLGIDNTELTISLDPPVDLDKSQYGVTVGIGHKPKKIFIMLDSGLSTGEKIRTLAHEMVHAHQIARGDLAILSLEDGKIKGEWEGEEFNFIRYSRSNPWEVEAYTKEKTLHKLVINKIGNYQSSD